MPNFMRPVRQAVDRSGPSRPGWRSVPVALSAVVLVVLIPVLEVSDTHLLNPDWPPHARFHEAWQLLANAGLALAALWLAVARGRERLAAALDLIIVVALMAASALGGLYGGAIQRPGSGELQVFGLDGALVIMSMLAIALAVAAMPGRSGSIRL